MQTKSNKKCLILDCLIAPGRYLLYCVVYHVKTHINHINFISKQVLIISSVVMAFPIYTISAHISGGRNKSPISNLRSRRLCSTLAGSFSCICLFISRDAFTSSAFLDLTQYLHWRYYLLLILSSNAVHNSSSVSKYTYHSIIYPMIII